MLNKLIRDGVYESMLGLGQKPELVELSDEGYVAALKDKVAEEASEIDITNTELVKELADLLEVIESIDHVAGLTFDEIRAKQQELAEKSGTFEGRRFIKQLDLQDDDEWADYYASDPTRFKEI